MALISISIPPAGPGIPQKSVTVELPSEPAALYYEQVVGPQVIYDKDAPGDGFFHPWRSHSSLALIEGVWTAVLSTGFAREWDGGQLKFSPIEVEDGESGAPTSAKYVIFPGEDIEPVNARALTAGTNITVTEVDDNVVVAAPGLAPNTPKYLVAQSHAGLTNERVLVQGANILISEDGEAGEVQIDCTLTPEVTFYEQAGDETSIESTTLAIGAGLKLDDAGDGTPVLSHNFEGGAGIELTEEVGGELDTPTGKLIVSSTVRKGTITISGANSSGNVVLSPAMADSSYNVQLTVSAITGSPGSASHIPRTSSRATGGFTVNLFGSPGVGTDITFAWLVTP